MLFTEMIGSYCSVKERKGNYTPEGGPREGSGDPETNRANASIPLPLNSEAGRQGEKFESSTSVRNTDAR